MFAINSKISLRQLQVLFILDIFGTAVLTMPRTTAVHAEQNGWVLIIGAGIIILILAEIMCRLASKFPNETFVEFSQKLVTKPIGILLSLGFLFKIIISTSLELRIMCEILRQTMLPATPLFINSGIMLLICVYVATKGYESRARAAELLFLFMILPMAFMLIFSGINADYTNLLPTTALNSETILKGSFFTMFSFRGVEFILLMYPYINKHKEAKRAAKQAIILIAILMVITTVIATARFGSDNVKLKIWPTIQMMDTIDVPGSFMEKQDAVLMSFYMVSFYSVISAGLYFSSLIGIRLLKEQVRMKKSLYIIVPIVFAFSLLPNSIGSVYEYLYLNNIVFGLTYIFIIPLILLIIANLRKGLWK